MKTNFINNQLSTCLQADAPETEKQNADRVFELRVWQLGDGPSFEALGRLLKPAISGSAVQRLLKARRISFTRHADFLAAGVPEHLLPPPQNFAAGRPPRCSNIHLTQNDSDTKNS